MFARMLMILSGIGIAFLTLSVLPIDDTGEATIVPSRPVAVQSVLRPTPQPRQSSPCLCDCPASALWPENMGTYTTSFDPTCSCCSSSSSSSGNGCCDSFAVPLLATVTPQGGSCGCTTPVTFQIFGADVTTDMSVTCGLAIPPSGHIEGWSSAGSQTYCTDKAIRISLACTGNVWYLFTQGGGQCLPGDVTDHCTSAQNQLSCPAVMLQFNGIPNCGFAQFGSDCILNITITN